jgi:hypothetical protein
MFKFLLFLHVISAIVAFGPLLVFPLFTRASPRVSAVQVVTALQRLVLPGLIGLVVFGSGAVGASPGKEFSFSQAWVSMAFLLVIIALAVVWFVLVPAHRKVIEARDDNDAATLAKKAAGLTGVMHVILVVALVLMVWQPGK